MKDSAAEREIKSFWWAPNRPETRWFGTLTLARGAMPHLELVVERTNLFDDRMPLGRVLHGKDEHGKPITLLFASESGSTISNAVVKRDFCTGYAVLGMALSRPEEFVVNELCLQLQQLYGWLGITGFDRPTATAAGELTIRNRQPVDAVFAVNSDLDVGVRFRSVLHDRVGSQQIDEIPVFAFISKSGLSLNRPDDRPGPPACRDASWRGAGRPAGIGRRQTARAGGDDGSDRMNPIFHSQLLHSPSFGLPRRGENSPAQGNALGHQPITLQPALKGRHSGRANVEHAAVDTEFRPFRAWPPLTTEFPGRCPGLASRCAFGAHLYAQEESAVDAKLAALELRRAALASLFTSLLHHLITGQVRLPEFRNSPTERGKNGGRYAHDVCG